MNNKRKDELCIDIATTKRHKSHNLLYNNLDELDVIAARNVLLQYIDIIHRNENHEEYERYHKRIATYHGLLFKLLDRGHKSEILFDTIKHLGTAEDLIKKYEITKGTYNESSQYAFYK